MIGFALVKSIRNLYELFWPATDLWYQLGPWLLLYGLGAAWLSGWLRTEKNVRVPYTRKIFHFLIIPVAAIVQVYWGLGGTVVYGTLVSTIVLVAVCWEDGLPFYEALARPKDAPRQSLFIIVPLVMTGLGGVLSNLFFGSMSTVGYWVCGFGDAVGEPVGARYGDHPYEVPSMAGIPAERTLEGSAAVFIAGSFAAILALFLGGHEPATAFQVGIACGAVSCVTEAFSNHGLDNLTLQLAGSGTAFLLLSG